MRLNETIERALNAYEEVNRNPLRRPALFFDHCETISDRNIDAVKALGGGIAVQNAWLPGRIFRHAVWPTTSQAHSPIRRMLEMGVPVETGTDAPAFPATTLPFLYWLIAARPSGSQPLSARERLDREEASSSTPWGAVGFLRKTGKKGAPRPGQLADLAVLSADYFSIPRKKSSISNRTYDRRREGRLCTMNSQNLRRLHCL